MGAAKTGARVFWGTTLLATLLPPVTYGAAARTPPAQISYDLTIDAPTERVSNGEIEGTITITSWPKSETRCLFLPQNHPDYLLDPARGISPSLLKFGRNQRQPGQTTMAVPPSLERLTPYLYRLNPGQQLPLKIPFHTTLPRWPDKESRRWLFTDFYPLPLENCPALTTDAADFQKPISSTIRYSFRPGHDEDLHHPGVASGTNDFVFHGAKLTVYRGHVQRHYHEVIGGVSVEIIYFSSAFRHLIPHITQLFHDTQTMTLAAIQAEAGPIAAFVREQRNELGYTQEELAERVGVGLRFLRELERGKPSLQMNKVNQVLNYFGRCLGVVEKDLRDG